MKTIKPNDEDDRQGKKSGRIGKVYSSGDLIITEEKIAKYNLAGTKKHDDIEGRIKSCQRDILPLHKPQKRESPLKRTHREQLEKDSKRRLISKLNTVDISCEESPIQLSNNFSINESSLDWGKSRAMDRFNCNTEGIYQEVVAKEETFCLVVLPPSCERVLSGFGSVSLISGSAEIDGFTLKTPRSESTTDVTDLAGFESMAIERKSTGQTDSLDSPNKNFTKFYSLNSLSLLTIRTGDKLKTSKKEKPLKADEVCIDLDEEIDNKSPIIESGGDSSKPSVFIKPHMNASYQRGRLMASISQLPLNLSEDLLERIVSAVSASSSVLCFRRLKHDAVTRVLGNFEQYQSIMENEHPNAERVMFDADLALCVPDLCERKVLTVPREHISVIDSVVDRLLHANVDNPVVVIAGSQNTGKSTLTRHIINRLLSHVPKAALLDCDLGQTEMTPSGHVSLTVLSEPLLGPPCTHQNRQVECSAWFGGLSPQDDPRRYFECIRFAKHAIGDIGRRVPVVVNTMGWTQGLGLRLFIDTVRIMRPSCIVQLNSERPHGNYPEALSTEYIRQANGLTTKSTKEEFKETFGTEVSDVDPCLDYVYPPHHLYALQSAASDGRQKSVNFSAPDHRTMTLIGYLSPIWINNPLYSPCLNALIPYEVPWASVAVHVEPMQIRRASVLLVLNASLVALCHVRPRSIETVDEQLPRFLAKTPVCKSLGYGFIRAICRERRLFYILTPATDLNEVNCLIKGAVDIPSACLLQQAQKLGEDGLPYVSIPSARGPADHSIARRRFLLRKVPVTPAGRGDV